MLTALPVGCTCASILNMHPENDIVIARPETTTTHSFGRFVVRIDDLVHYVIALMLLILAVAVIGNTMIEFAKSSEHFSLRVTYAVNSVLFVIILMEILRTVLAHVTSGAFQLVPFIAIGIISAVRHILTVGSALTMGKTLDDSEFNRLLLELGVNTGVALGLVVALVLLRRSQANESAEPASSARS